MLFRKTAPEATSRDADVNNLWQLYRPAAAGQRCRFSAGASCRGRSAAVTVKAFVLFAQVDPQQAAQIKLFLLFLHLSIARTSNSSPHPWNGDPGAASSKSSQTFFLISRAHSVLICPLMPGSAPCKNLSACSLYVFPLQRPSAGARCYNVFINSSSSFSPPLSRPASLHSPLSRSDLSCVLDTNCSWTQNPWTEQEGRERTYS